jgi:hypothetical protein
MESGQSVPLLNVKLVYASRNILHMCLHTYVILKIVFCLIQSPRVSTTKKTSSGKFPQLSTTLHEIKKQINSIQLCPSEKVNASADSREIPCFLINSNVHYRCHSSLPLIPTVNSLPLRFFAIYFSTSPIYPKVFQVVSIVKFSQLK